MLMPMNNIVGTRVRLDYFDQNEDFAPLLPRSGTISRQLTSRDGADDWFLVNLDDPFEYQIKVGEGYQYSLLKCDKLLVRSRWADYEVGGKEETSVFILLVPDDFLIEKEPIDIDKFHHVAWGMCHSEHT